jgi:hypothetical protein
MLKSERNGSKVRGYVWSEPVDKRNSEKPTVMSRKGLVRIDGRESEFIA